MLALQGDLENHGGTVALQTTIDHLRFHNENWHVRIAGEPTEITCDMVVNAAGLGAVALAGRIEGYPSDRIPTLYLAKGNYFGYSGRAPFRHLIYPAPVDGGLGIHLTMDLAGRIKFGPDVEWIEEIGYQVTSDRRSSFAQSVARYWPGVNPEMLFPDYAGIRPKLTGPNQPAADFRIDGPEVHSLPRLVSLFGIESPGLTSSLSIADEVVGLLHS
jgi:L-2-hydroxyglutarate oxidase LhgO